MRTERRAWLDRVKARQAEATLKGKRNHSQQFIDWLDTRGVGLDEVSAIQINDWIDHQLNNGFSDRTVQSRVYSISDWFSYMVNRDVVDSNPVDGVDLSFLNDARINAETDVRYIEKEQYEKMVSGDLPIRDEIVIRLLWNTGVRASEAVNIKLENVDRDERALVVGDAKDETGTRRVFYSRRMGRRLREYLDRGGRDSQIGAIDSPYLLVSRRVEQMGSQRVNIIVRERAEEVGIQRTVYTDQDGRERNLVTAHTMRHSFATHRVKQGMDISLLSDLLGHDSLDSTRIYLQYSDDDLRKADDKYRP